MDVPGEKIIGNAVVVFGRKPTGYSLLCGLVIAFAITAFVLLALATHWTLADFDNCSIHNEKLIFGTFFGAFIGGTLYVIIFGRSDISPRAKISELDKRQSEIEKRERLVEHRAKEDVLSPFRKKLVGDWDIEFQSWIHDSQGNSDTKLGMLRAQFTLDESTLKLKLKFKVPSSKYYFEKEAVVEAISVWPVLNPENLDYSFDLRMTRQRTARPAIGSIFVHMKITSEGDEPTLMTGTWYDLDGTFADVEREVESAGRSTKLPLLPARGEITFRKCLVTSDFDLVKTAYIDPQQSVESVS